MKDKDELKRKYELEHGYISSTGEERTAYSLDGTDDLTNESAGLADREEPVTIASEPGTGGEIDEIRRDVPKRNRRSGKRGRTSEYDSGSLYQDTSGNVGDVGEQGSSEGIELDQRRIINVATPKPKRERKPKTQATKPVFVDVLAGPQVEEYRERLRTAFIGIFKAFDDFINISLAEKPPERIYIWTMIDDREIDTLVNARISRATKSVIEAKVVKVIIDIYEQFATGLITVPRMWQTLMVYDQYGFKMPGSDAFGKNRRRRNLRVVNAQPSTRQ